MSLTFTIDADLSRLNATMSALESVISDASLREYLEQAANPHITERAAARFHNEGDDVVGRWAALRPATVNIRESMGYGGDHPINYRTGELERYIVDNAGRIDATGIGMELVTPGDTADGELALKLSTAQKGKSGNPQVEKRPVLGINETDGIVLTELLELHIRGRFGGVL